MSTQEPVKIKLSLDFVWSFRGPVATFGKIYKESGPLGFWRGTGPTVLRMTIGAGLHFVCLEAIKNLLASTHLKERNDALHNALVGGILDHRLLFLILDYRIVERVSDSHAVSNNCHQDSNGVCQSTLHLNSQCCIHYSQERRRQRTIQVRPFLGPGLSNSVEVLSLHS